MARVEDDGRIAQKRRLFLLHPGLIGHVGVDVMHLPAVRDRKMVRQDLIIDENEAIFPEISVRGAVVGVFDEIAIGIGRLRQVGREFGRVVDLFEIVAAMGPDRPGQDGGCRRKGGLQLLNGKSVPAFWRTMFGMRQPGMSVSRSATASRVVRRILRGWLTVGLPSARPDRRPAAASRRPDPHPKSG